MTTTTAERLQQAKASRRQEAAAEYQRLLVKVSPDASDDERLAEVLIVLGKSVADIEGDTVMVRQAEANASEAARLPELQAEAAAARREYAVFLGDGKVESIADSFPVRGIRWAWRRESEAKVQTEQKRLAEAVKRTTSGLAAAKAAAQCVREFAKWRQELQSEDKPCV